MNSIVAFSVSIIVTRYFACKKNVESIDCDSNLEEISDDNETAHKIFKFCITGGPSGGKTTAIDRLQGFLRMRGI